MLSTLGPHGVHRAEAMVAQCTLVAKFRVIHGMGTSDVLTHSVNAVDAMLVGSNTQDVWILDAQVTQVAIATSALI